MTDIIIWIALVGFLMFAFYRYIITPDKCPHCKTRMIHQCRPRNGKLVSSQECPNCGYEIILDER